MELLSTPFGGRCRKITAGENNDAAPGELHASRGSRGVGVLFAQGWVAQVIVKPLLAVAIKLVPPCCLLGPLAALAMHVKRKAFGGKRRSNGLFRGCAQERSLGLVR